MAEENYMDRFSNPEEFIRQQILAKGNFSSLDKKEMYRLIRVYNIEFQIHTSGLAYTKKQDMLDALLKKISYRELARYVNVSKQSFCMKFGITDDEFKILVEKGLIHPTNAYMSLKHCGTGDAKWSQWSGYNVYDYFNLSTDEIKSVLQSY
ncbi:MAG: hypothetical protein IIT39_00260 [Clostridia bacterium]|nr:hypothetical protein [Clostridia bacterium]